MKQNVILMGIECKTLFGTQIFLAKGGTGGGYKFSGN